MKCKVLSDKEIEREQVEIEGEIYIKKFKFFIPRPTSIRAVVIVIITTYKARVMLTLV